MEGNVQKTAARGLDTDGTEQEIRGRGRREQVKMLTFSLLASQKDRMRCEDIRGTDKMKFMFI